MRVRIVSYEDINAWILGKFARKLHEELIKLGVNADISNKPDADADINHHIIYLGYNVGTATKADTLMITHIDDIRKLQMLTTQMKAAKAGICMSESVMNELVTQGVPKNKICYINPAHDDIMRPRKIVIGVTSKVQPDGCKREELVEELFNNISPEIFSLSIMGAGWDKIVERLRKKGHTVTYYDEFNYKKYSELVPSFDYYIYTGQDEGSMGFIDALAAGVRTVVTPQGFHLDAPLGIYKSFNESHELISIFKEIEKEKLTLIDAVSSWTWKDYAIKHLELWKYILKPDDAQKSEYSDGLNSLLGNKKPRDEKQAQEFRKRLIKGAFRRSLKKTKKLSDIKFVVKKLKRLLGVYVL
ncbi:MAG TPA: hypothetical protein VK625_02280 [Flavitalea sp.]|nr:hypothetical protein [Flavitalea sp.]